ncbi:MAG TPA: hypothetical protein VNO18_21820 [Xanthobacteraceae bacterium]|nr:hypothetical protein [Xanthobacteraceae bacterium]
MKRAYFIPLAVLADLWSLSVMAQTTVAQGNQPAQHSGWAVPLALAGVPNLHRVAPNFTGALNLMRKVLRRL